MAASGISTNRREGGNAGSVRWVVVALGSCAFLVSFALMHPKLGAPAVTTISGRDVESIGLQWSPEYVGETSAVQKFSNQEYHRHLCLRGLQERIREDYAPYFEKYPGGVALIDVALHGNLGDVLLWRGATALLADFGISPVTICYISQPAWHESIDKKAVKCDFDKVVSLVKNRGLVLFQAGGNWGDLYRFIQDHRMRWLRKLHEKAKKYKFGIVQLPQSIYYTPGSSKLGVDSALLKQMDPEVYTLFVRSQPSYDIAKANYGNATVKLTPDLVFALGALTPNHEPTYDILILERWDRESNTTKGSGVWDWIKEEVAAANLTYHVQDWGYKRSEHPREVSKSAFPLFADVRTAGANFQVSKGKVVITNRLHGSVMSTLLGKHLFYVDTKEGKVGFVRENAFSGSEHCTAENLHAHRKESLKDAVAAAIELLLSNGDDFVYN